MIAFKRKYSLFLDIQNYRDIMDQKGPEDSPTAGSSNAMGNGSLPSGVVPGKKNSPVNRSLYQYLVVNMIMEKHRKALLNSIFFRKPKSSSQPAPGHQPCISARSKY